MKRFILNELGQLLPGYAGNKIQNDNGNCASPADASNAKGEGEADKMRRDAKRAEENILQTNLKRSNHWLMFERAEAYAERLRCASTYRILSSV